jgi:hypothetical protein
VCKESGVKGLKCIESGAHRAVAGSIHCCLDGVADAVLDGGDVGAEELGETGRHGGEAELVLWAIFRAALQYVTRAEHGMGRSQSLEGARHSMIETQNTGASYGRQRIAHGVARQSDLGLGTCEIYGNGEFYGNVLTISVSRQR